jgi:hypothetical protein
MAMTAFTLDTDPGIIRDFFAEQGFALFAGLAPETLFAPLRQQLADLAGIAFPGLGITAGSVVERDLVRAAAIDRRRVGSLYDTAHTLPALFGLLDRPEFAKMIAAVGSGPAVVGDTPRLRMDFPNEDQFLTVDHQEYTYYDCPASSVTIWMPLAPVTEEMGLLRVRPGSHRAGHLPVRQIPERPYFLIEPGEWEQRYPAVEAVVPMGHALVFSNGIIHASGMNRSDRPRITLQLRYNALNDPLYRDAGWPRTFVTVARKDRDLHRRFHS